MIDIINLHFRETLIAAGGSCLLLAPTNFHVTPMKISSSHWNSAAWTSKNSGKIDRGVVDIIFLNFWESGKSLSLDYPWNKNNIRLMWITSLGNAFKRDHINKSQNAKYCFQFAHLSKILILKFPVFQHKKNFYKREKYFWTWGFTGF